MNASSDATQAEVARRSATTRALWGCDDDASWLRESGVVHVAAVWIDPRGRTYSYRVGPGAPRHPLDRLALTIARARARIIVVTGETLRREPQLRYELHPDDAIARDWLQWRAQTLGPEAPQLWIFSTRGVSPDHPALSSWPRAHVIDASSAVTARESSGATREGARHEGLRQRLQRAREEGHRQDPARGAIALEAGPTTTYPLYDPPGLIDQILVTRVRGPLDPALVLPAPWPEDVVAADFDTLAEGPPHPLGPWQFQCAALGRRKPTASAP